MASFKKVFKMKKNKTTRQLITAEEFLNEIAPIGVCIGVFRGKPISIYGTETAIRKLRKLLKN